MAIKHIVSYSGGIGSWATAKRVIEQHGLDDTLLVYTDTKNESPDVYRFLTETVDEIAGRLDSELVEFARNTPPVWEEEARSAHLDTLGKRMNETYSFFLWLADGRTVWEVFKDNRFIGNSGVDICSRVLKRQLFNRWLKDTYMPWECVNYVGMDWSEIHRYERAVPRWQPYELQAPMCDPPYLSKIDMMNEVRKLGIEPPEMYEQSFPHANCGGACVKAGHGQWKLVLEESPEVYAYNERKEQEIRDYLGRDVSILSRTRDNVKTPLTLRALRLEMERRKQGQGEQMTLDLDDFGSCGCFIDSDADDACDLVLKERDE